MEFEDHVGSVCSTTHKIRPVLSAAVCEMQVSLLAVFCCRQ
jgi:hypothetical protein